MMSMVDLVAIGNVCINFVGSSPLSSLTLLVKSIEEEIQPFGDCVDSARGHKLKQY